VSQVLRDLLSEVPDGVDFVLVPLAAPTTEVTRYDCPAIGARLSRVRFMGGQLGDGRTIRLIG
jgi:hypothetical protein